MELSMDLTARQEADKEQRECGGGVLTQILIDRMGLVSLINSIKYENAVWHAQKG